MAETARAVRRRFPRPAVAARAVDDARPTLAMAVRCLAVAAVVAVANRDHIEQSSIYQTHYLGLARYLQGGAPPAEFTYPMWGYPAVLSILPEAESFSITLQVLLGVALVLALYATMARFVESRRLARLLCIGALPIWSLASLKLADPWSVMLGALGVLALARAVAVGRWGWALASGAAFGAALNFRSDFVLVLPLLTLILAGIAPHLAWARRRELLVTMTVALLSLLPWGLFRVAHGAPFALTSSNGGMVLYNALGIAGNPWGIVGDDLDRAAEVRAALGPDANAFSVAGDQLLFERALARIREHPEAYARKVAHDMLASVTLGSYGIEVEPLLGDESAALRFEVLKEQVKLRVGLAPNVHDVERFRRAGVWSESLASTPPAVWLAAGLRAGHSALTGGFLLLSLLAGAWILVADRRRLAQPEIAVLLAGLFAAWGAVCAVSYQPRLTNVLYVFGAPILLVAMQSVRERIAARGQRGASRGLRLAVLPTRADAGTREVPGLRGRPDHFSSVRS